jgi:allantoinase
VDYDHVIRGGTIVSGGQSRIADVGIRDGVIEAVEPSLGGGSTSETDATGLHVLPGGIDAHVHVNEPGRTSWEGYDTASTALAMGGMTSFFDMPINSQPPTTNVAAFEMKLERALRHSRVDFGLWGGLVPGNLNELDALHRRGVVGFKAFMCETGLEEFRPADDLTLWEGMARCAELGAIIAVHAENDTITSDLAARARAQRRIAARDYLHSRPPIAETEAITRAIELAASTGCRLHVVHVSTARGADLIAAAQRRGVDVSGETCPHYLALTSDDIVRIGAMAKCSPPVRSIADQDRLWEFVEGNEQTLVASDHSPSPPSEKESDDFFAIWGGVSGCQSTLPVLLHGQEARSVQLQSVISAVSERVATRFSLPQKGAVECGKDADVVLIDLSESWTLTEADLYYRHAQSPLCGQRMRGRVHHVLLRGRTVVADGSPIGSVRGHLISPAPR